MINLAMMERRSTEQPVIRHYRLEALLPAGQCLALQYPLGVLALFEQTTEGSQMRAVQQFTPSELLVLVPMLSWYPEFTPYENLLAHFETGKLQLSDEVIGTYRRRINQALDGSGPTFEFLLRPVRNVISRTRLKLHALDLDVVSLLETGYRLRRLPAHKKCPEGQ